MQENRFLFNDREIFHGIPSFTTLSSPFLLPSLSSFSTLHHLSLSPSPSPPPSSFNTLLSFLTSIFNPPPPSNTSSPPYLFPSSPPPPPPSPFLPLPPPFLLPLPLPFSSSSSCSRAFKRMNQGEEEDKKGGGGEEEKTAAPYFFIYYFFKERQHLYLQLADIAISCKMARSVVMNVIISSF